MIRGSLSNNLLPTLWVHSDVLIECQGRKLFIGPKKYSLKNQSWLWSISYFVKPLVVFIGDSPNKLLQDYEYLVFNNFQECKDALRRDSRAVELVVNDPTLVSHEVVLFSPSIKRYC